MKGYRALLKSVAEGDFSAAMELSGARLRIPVSPLVALMKDGSSPESRSAAAYVLGFGRHSSARACLESVVADCSEHGSVRGHAAEALAYIGSKKSVPFLIESLKDDCTEVRYWCAFALGQIGDARAIGPLQTLADDSTEEHFHEVGPNNRVSIRQEALDAINDINRSVGARS